MCKVLQAVAPEGLHPFLTADWSLPMICLHSWPCWEPASEEQTLLTLAVKELHPPHAACPPLQVWGTRLCSAPV